MKVREALEYIVTTGKMGDIQRKDDEWSQMGGYKQN